MSYPIFVTSPCPQPLDREPNWNAQVTNYDSGGRQASTGWERPLYKYGFQLSNIPRQKQSSLHHFFNQRKAEVEPFLFKDPYDYLANGIVHAFSGTAIAVNSGFHFRDVNSWRFIPDSGHTLLTSALSGALTPNSHYVTSLDNGWIKLIIGKATADTITVSAQYLRKVAFVSYSEQSFIWDQFTGSVHIEEMLP